MFKEKLAGLLRLLNELNDAEAQKDVTEMIRNSAIYIQKVLELESVFMMRPFTEAGEYREKVSELDRSRSFAHNTLITYVKILNRYCKMVGIDTVFEGDTDNRIEVANFAGELVQEMFNTRRL